MAQFIAYTGREEIASLAFEWKISEFGEKIKTAKTGDAVKLNNVHVGESNWDFEVFANGDDPDTKKTVSIICVSRNETEKTARVSIDVVYTIGKNEKEVYKTCKFTHTFKGGDGTNESPIICYGTHIMTHEEFNDNVKLLSNGNLLLFINITVLGVEKTTRRPTTEYDFQEIGSIEMKQKLKAIEHFKDGWASQDFSDVTIKCQGEVFYCHRMILARRSPYFRGMLESGLDESKTQVINLDNMDVHILKAILKFIYGGEIGNLEVNGVDLLQASNRFMIEDLKDICEQYLLARYVNLDNAIDVLVMADAHNANDLKKGAMEMIVANRDAIVKQVGWEEKLVDKPKLLLEIFKSTASKNDTDMDT